MKNRIIKLISLGGTIILALVLGFLVVKKVSEAKNNKKIIAANFISYDFARAILGSDTEVKMLLKPGAEAHSFEPTPEDIIKIKNADLFIYVGGESDEWIEDLLNDNEIEDKKNLRLFDLVELKKEEISEGMEEEEEEEEYDEHIWTSPKNAIKLVSGINDKLSGIYPERKAEFLENTTKYIKELEKVDNEFREVVGKSEKKELIFGDRFPFRYFTDEYGLKYYAAFPGCSDQTEASSGTIRFLIEKIKADKIDVILKIEMTSGKLAETLAEETGAEVLELNAAHNISQEEFENKTTYVDIMKKNVKVIEKALK